MINLPIFRAKKTDSDEYIEFESFYKYDNKYYAITRIINHTLDGWFANVQIPLTQKIDPTTLAIHFFDMLDSKGNKIFASLSEDGKGGDRLEAFNKIFIAKYSKEDGSFLVVSSSGSGLFGKNYLKINFKLIGIQQ